MDIQTFRNNLPEFADQSKWPDSAFTYWSTIGEKLVDAERFGDLASSAVELFTAHNIVLERSALDASTSGTLPGTDVGVITAKKVGDVGVNYDVASSMEAGAGHWNKTIYGQRYIRLVHLLGAGCYQL